MTMTDVLIVGAGPTGLTLGAVLTEHGVTTTVVDAQSAGENTSRACAVASRTLEVLERIDVSRQLVAQGVQNPRFSMRDRDRMLIPIDFSTLPTSYPYTLTISQANTERALLDRLTQLGGEVVRPRTLTGLTQDDESVVATFDNGDPITARYVVGADGMHSAVRAQAQIGFRGHEYPESFALADVRLRGSAPANEIFLFYAPAGLTVVAPLPGGLYRIVAPVENAPASPSAEFVQQLLDARGFGPGQLVVEDVIWGSHFRIHHRVADTYRAGRLLLAGDAAHVHSPAGGQGMNTGIQDAVALADALEQVLAGGPESLLDRYGDDRRVVAQHVLSLTGRLTTMATLPPVLRPARNVAMRLSSQVPAVRRQLAWRLSGLVYR
ncbi:NAD(P)/FAD-dependent oxidoreductase [Mycobacterium sp. 1245111.1]|uniref:FAD-dependent oxidoreductase n=1 Tax=Mycobacterium sp. 1245111.1 TaxID=1834073 RepID=UPI0009F4A296|nr:FAD-dependent monooxygenase [Mycobacterium sp. 1245111.1]